MNVTTTTRTTMTTSDTKRILLKYTIIPSILLSIVAIFALDLNAWKTPDVHHFYFEMFAVVLAAIFAFYCLLRAYKLDDRFYLFFGLGFLASTSFDLFHAIVAFSSAGNHQFLQHFIPQTWFAGRTFISAMMVIAIVKYSYNNSLRPPSSPNTSRTASPHHNDHNNKRQVLPLPPFEEKKESNAYANSDSAFSSHSFPSPSLRSIVFAILLLVFTSSIVFILSLFTILPFVTISNDLFHRPYEIPAIVLFSIALLFFYKKRAYRANDVFYKGLILSLIVDIFSQIIMSYSAASFDTAHNIAHILKVIAYSINVLSLASSNIQYNVKLKEREATIRQQYELLQAHEKIQREFINIAAHELRTPIQPILMNSEALMRKLPENERVSIIARNAARLQQLTSDILDVARIESQTLKLNLGRFSLKQVTLQLVNDYKEHIVDKDKVKLHCQFESDQDDGSSSDGNEIYVEGDKARITQVLSNLLTNAISFTKEGAILVTVEKKKDEKEQDAVLVSVKDTGTGIDTEILPRLFTKFASKSLSGTGLGLFISKSIVEAHGGRIWAENNSNGKGATFSFSLPAHQTHIQTPRFNTYCEMTK